MERREITPRKDWENIIRKQGLIVQNGTKENPTPYWNESAYYVLSNSERTLLEKATSEIYSMSYKAIDYIIDNNLFSMFAIPEAIIPLIKESWKNRKPGLCGRMDFIFVDGIPKLLEYNADTYGMALEMKVQKSWINDVFPNATQFNSLHDSLVDKWKDLKKYCGNEMHFCCNDFPDDIMNVDYFEQAAQEAGIKTTRLFAHEVDGDPNDYSIVDKEGKTIKFLFKYTCWEWLIKEMPFEYLESANMNAFWIEPIWRMLWSNKAFMAILWEMYPESQYLLPSFVDGPRDMKSYVKKPLFSLAGENVYLYKNKKLIAKTPGIFGRKGYMFQQLCEQQSYDGNYPVIGSWMVPGKGPAGIGILETKGLITDGTSQFVPHIIE